MKPSIQQPPSPWVQRWAGLIPAGGRVLDVACGMGRHALYLAGLGYQVTAVDADLTLSQPVRDTPGVSWLEHDLEARPWPFSEATWEGVLVSNYLHRALFPHLLAALTTGGVLIYTTFAHGQQRHGRPRNPHHLLMPGELLEWARGGLRVVAYEDVEEGPPLPARRQRLVAIKP